MSSEFEVKFWGRRLVILGCGYVGSQLAIEALARRMQVTVLTRNASTASGLHARGVTAVRTNLAADDWHGRIAGDADFVVNCVSSGGAGLEGYRQSYVDGMNSALHWARTAGRAGTFLYTGSTSVYPQDHGLRVDETASTTAASERAQILLQAEAALQANDGACARWFILRLAGIYGPGRHGLLDQVRTGGITGRGEHRLNLVYRDDICSAVWLALGAPAGVANEIFNVADDGATRKSDIAGWLASRLGLPAPQFSGDPGAGRRTAALDRIVDNQKIKTVLGWRPACPTFREGYEKILSRS